NAVLTHVGDPGEERRRIELRADAFPRFDGNDSEQDHGRKVEGAARRIGNSRTEDIEKSAQRRPHDGGKLTRGSRRGNRARKQILWDDGGQESLLSWRLE